MLRYIVPAVFSIGLMVSPAVAAEKTEKAKCLEQVADVKEMMKSEETPKLGDKSEAAVLNLVEISEHLCEQGNFVYAGQLLELARGYLATEGG